MKVLLLTDGMENGGAETHIAGLAGALRKRGIGVAVCSGGGRIADELEKEGIAQYRFRLGKRRSGLFSLLAELIRMKRAIGRAIRREAPDILHAHSRRTAFLLPRRSQKYGGIVTAHAAFRGGPRILRRLCRWGDRTVAVSEDVRELLLRDYRLPPGSVSVIPNGIDCEKFAPCGGEERGTVGENGGFEGNAFRGGTSPTILFASRLDRDCSIGAKLLCRIAPGLSQTYPGLRVRIAGGGDAFREVSLLAAHVNRITGKKTVELCGTVTDMREFLSSGDLFVGVSRAAMEAALCGCAVILCGDEGYGGILTAQTDAARSNYCCRGKAPASREALERDLRTLLADGGFRRAVALSAGEKIRRECNLTDVCEKTLTLYYHLLRAKHENPRNGEKKRVCIGGYAGCGNLGDDAILAGFLSGVSEKYAVTALTGNPSRDEKRFFCRCVGRKNPFSVVRALRGSELFLCGGGSLLQSVTGLPSLLYYLGLLRLARLCGCRTVLFAGGVGPFRSRIGLRLLKKELNRCASVSLRDAASAEFLERLGVEKKLITIGADPAFLLPVPGATAREGIRERCGLLPSERYFCLSLCAPPEGEERLAAILRAAIRSFARRNGATPVFLPTDPRRDFSFSQRICNATGGKLFVPQEPEELLAILSGGILTVGMRLHPLILSFSAGVPSAAVSPDGRETKIGAFAAEAGISFRGIEKTNAVGLISDMERALAEPRREDPARPFREKAEKTLANIDKLLYNKDNPDFSERKPI